ncbi:ComF family protein [Halodurantibacterium flavum]|uniref:ComF family protein n=1 Tax=Halodurantibacterium flavum TaxID=1382802 RepID=A0ABW4S837_9RHOB
MQSVLQAIFPAECLSCRAHIARGPGSGPGLCGACWRDTAFVAGLCCDHCGVQLPGQEAQATLCDDCLSTPRPWARGRAVMTYGGVGRRLILALKHGDRLNIARPAGMWMARAAAPILLPDMVVAPVPLHWTRLLRRRYNQSALLSRALAREAGLDHCPDLLLRRRRTSSQDGKGRAERAENLAGAITAHPRRTVRMQGRNVLLVDDVMTSGATLAEAARACLEAGAAGVRIVVLARVAKNA